MKKILRGLFTIIGLALGGIGGNAIEDIPYFSKYISKNNTLESVLLIIFLTLIVGLIFFLISPFIIKALTKFVDYLEMNTKKASTSEIIFGTIGALLGLVVSASIFGIFQLSGLWLWKVIEVTVCIIVAIFSGDIAVKKREDMMAFFANLKRNSAAKEKRTKEKDKTAKRGIPKVLDTSVIIDGRIFDICQTGFVEGTLIIPNFVLGELRHIADSSDGLKRNRGRRGLDILNKIQKELNVEVQIYEKDFPDIKEVDIKLLKLAQVMNGKVITNDYNLNKVAEFQGVPVLNINELANAVKPVVLPGEEMKITIIKDGKESGQGIAYLDDGTMIVVEGGRKHIGENLTVAVTSVLQTAAGRMIFAKQKEN
ncbi:MAG: PIN/TRAM domain-containing protein [Clostridium sp.]|nr:PIN/TRAM domain-containing protein [Clostridium sp.]